MLWYQSVFRRSRRYASPTCFLEISLKRSLRSLCTGQCPRNHIQFQLIVDAPQTCSEQRLAIAGDALALEELYCAVTFYAKQFLIRDRTETNPAQFLLEDGLEGSSDAGDRVFQSALNQCNIPKHSTIHIQAYKSLHQIHLGLLATEQSGPTIQLGNLQLLDLVTVLDECIVDLMAMWPSQTSLKTMWWSFAKWTIGAIALLSFGFTAIHTTKNHRQFSPPPLNQSTLQSNPQSRSE